MKRMLITIIAVSTIILFSSPGFASLTAGTWDSTGGGLHNGAWLQVNDGTFPSLTGSTLYMTSPTLQWEYLGAQVTGYTIGDLTATKSGFFQDLTRTYESGTYQFRFFDGNTYSTTLDGTLSIRLYYNKNQHILGIGQAFFTGTGVIDQDPGFSLFVSMMPNEIWRTPEFSSGVVRDITWTISSNPVPIPATMLLLGSGLLGMIGIRRKLNQ